MSVTQEIKSRLDIVDIVSEHVALRKSGRSLSGLCPFHANTRTPAFYVFPETQTWHCFGACAEGGDVFSFVMKQQGWDFKEALERLAARAGVRLEAEKPVDPKKKAFKDKLGDLLEAAADYFHFLLLHAPQAEAARRYVQGRGLQEKTVEAFKLGFALDSWDACRSHFNAQGFDDQTLLDVGLLTENPEKGTRYDRFRNRLMFPIRNVDGRVVGFGARTLEKDGIPKYLNSPQTPLFDKSHLLFGLDTARRDIREARQVVIVEGYMDVIQAWQGGFGNVVAQMGTALTEAQLQLLKRYTKRFVLALDADAAGASATMRSLQVARETLDREVEIKFDARGLVQHEGRLQADIRIVTMPEGKDPDNIIREDAAAWTQLVASAKPVVAYVIEMATHGLDMNDAKAKTAVAEQVIPLIKDINNPVERDHYWQELARALRIDERALRQMRVSERPRPQSQSVTQRPSNQSNGKKAAEGLKRWRQQTAVTSGIAVALREANYLCQCLHYPTLITAVDQQLGEVEQAQVRESDFSTIEDRALFQQLKQQYSEGQFVTVAELCDSLDAPLQERAEALLSMPLTPESELDRLVDKLVLSVLDWRLQKINDRLSQLRMLFPETTRQQDEEAAGLYQQQTRDASNAIQRINVAKNAMSAANRRRSEAAYGR